MSADPARVSPGPGCGPGLYVHIPFCRFKCDYCAFVSLPCRRPPAFYLEAVLAQAGRLAELPWSREQTFASIFIGGGTPTIYEAEQLTALIAGLRRLFRLAPGAEITVESNPGTVSLKALQQLRAAGVNRISIGVQSFDDQLLRALGRRQSGAEARQALEWAMAAGFDNINLDLIYGLPGQHPDHFDDDLCTALEFFPAHLAIYQLMVEEKTPLAARLAAGAVALPDDDAVADLEAMARKILLMSGYCHYEIANYCRPGRECVHNLNYWRNGSYLGLGAAAVSCLDGLRISNVAAPGLYRRLVAAGQPPYAEAEALGREAAFRETVVMGLRLREGVEPAELERRFGLTPRTYYGPILAHLEAMGLLSFAGGRMALSDRAFPLANQVLAQLV